MPTLKHIMIAVLESQLSVKRAAIKSMGKSFSELYYATTAEVAEIEQQLRRLNDLKD